MVPAPNPDHSQYSSTFCTTWFKSVSNFLRYPLHRQTDRQTDSDDHNNSPSSLAEVTNNIHLTSLTPSLLNRFQTGQGHCNECRKKWGFTDNELCDCGETQTMSHIINSCPLTKFDGGLLRLHEADEAAVKHTAPSIRQQQQPLLITECTVPHLCRCWHVLLLAVQHLQKNHC